MLFKRCIVLLADGARPDVFDELLGNGRLPNIKKNIVERGTYTRAVTAFPSTTGPAHMPFLTGCLPATCNVPGIRWFDKTAYARGGHAPVFSMGVHGRYRSYVGLETFLINRDMRSDVYTAFEIIPRSYCIFNSINRGAGLGNLTKIMRIWYWFYGHQTERWRFVDENAAKKVLRAVDRDFKFLFAVFPGIDEYSHLNHPRHEFVLRQYYYLDAVVGRLFDKLSCRHKLDDTIVWIVSDHGLTKTHTHFCVNTFMESRGIKTFYFPLIYRKNCSVANMVSGNGMTHLYFKNLSGWGGPTTVEAINGMYPGMLDELLENPAIDVLAGRSEEGGISVRTKRGTARIGNKYGDIEYKVVGSDPFGYGSQFTRLRSHGATARQAPHDSRHFLASTIDTEYPDAPYQLAHIFTSPRCGDIVLSATPGYDLRLKYEVPEHRSSHGSLHREHMMVPILCNTKLPPAPIRTVDIFPTYLKLMGQKIPDNIDGVSLV